MYVTLRKLVIFICKFLVDTILNNLCVVYFIDGRTHLNNIQYKYMPLNSESVTAVRQKAKQNV